MLRVSGFRADEICPPPFFVHMYIFKEIVFYFKIGNFFTHHNLLLNLFKFKMVSTCYNLKMFLISCKQYTYIHRYSYMVYIIYLIYNYNSIIALPWKQFIQLSSSYQGIVLAFNQISFYLTSSSLFFKSSFKFFIYLVTTFVYLHRIYDQKSC